MIITLTNIQTATMTLVTDLGVDIPISYWKGGYAKVSSLGHLKTISSREKHSPPNHENSSQHKNGKPQKYLPIVFGIFLLLQYMMPSK